VKDAPAQGADLDCGIYLCYYCESFAKRHQHSWREVANMKWMRARIAGTILRNENCLTLERMQAAMSVDNLLMN
jgi:Ulp1 family protease